MAEIQECAQCGTPFTPMREHARFCSARCRMAWNREHAGVAAAPAVAIDWSVTAMTEAVGRFAAAGTWELPRLAAAVGETVWWVTLVDATLVRYYPNDYQRALAGSPARRETEETLAGLRYIRSQVGHSADPADFIDAQPPLDGSFSVAAWTWKSFPPPAPQHGAARRGKPARSGSTGHSSPVGPSKKS